MNHQTEVYKLLFTYSKGVGTIGKDTKAVVLEPKVDS